MGALLIILSIAASTLKGFCGKKTSVFAVRPPDASLFSFVRIFLCMIIGLALIFIEGAHTSLAVDPLMICICAFSGVTNAAFLIGWMLAVQKNPLVLVDVSLTLGSIIPAVLCLVFYGEQISFLKIIGYLLIVAAALVLSGRSASSQKTSASGIILVVIAAVGLGLTSFAQKIFSNTYGSGAGGTAFYPDSVFLFYGYVFAAIALLIYFAVVFFSQSRRQPEKSEPLSGALSRVLRPLPYIAVMALCLFGDNYFKQVAISFLPSQVVYPIIQGACLITVNITAILFGEKPTAKTLIGSAVAICGIVVLSLT